MKPVDKQAALGLGFRSQATPGREPGPSFFRLPHPRSGRGPRQKRLGMEAISVDDLSTLVAGIVESVTAFSASGQRVFRPGGQQAALSLLDRGLVKLMGREPNLRPDQFEGYDRVKRTLRAMLKDVGPAPG